MAAVGENEEVAMLESEFQTELRNQLKARFPGCLVLKQDPNMRQGIPDLLVLFEDKWASLETKRGFKSEKRPNQEYYVHQFDDMSFARFVNPENMTEVLDDLQSTFRPGG